MAASNLDKSKTGYGVVRKNVRINDSNSILIRNEFNSNNNHNYNHNNMHRFYENEYNNIKEFYKNAVIFITGATGYLGKTLIEKLLRSCNDLKAIYILMRPKRGITSEQRHKEFLKNQVFDRLRIEQPFALDKLLYISGDITQPYLGLSEKDLNFILDNTTIVFHSAATVKFNEGLKEAANLNACGTQRLLDLCLKMPNLKSIIHVSTAFCNPGRKYISETIYPPTPPMDKDSFMKCVTILPADILNSVTKQIMGSHPNTYTLTKSIAEQIVYEYSHKLPISIIRPSIVTCAIEEPYPGWVDNIQGITGIMTEVGRGTITSILADRNLICDIIPVDIVVNTMIGVAWLTGTQIPKQLQVFNCTSGQLRPITWQEIGYYTLKWAKINPSKYIMLYPNFSYRKNEFIHNIYVLFYQILPAYIFDLILKFQGKKPLMLKYARKIRGTCQIGKFFALNEWIFEVKNQKRLSKIMQLTTDGNEFDCNIENLDYDDYFRNYMLGIRKFVLKDGDDSIEKSRKKLLSLYGIKIFFQGFIFFSFAYIIFKWVLSSFKY